MVGMSATSSDLAGAVQVLATRALEVRSLYSDYERATAGREWTTADIMSGFVVDVGDPSADSSISSVVMPGVTP